MEIKHFSVVFVCLKALLISPLPCPIFLACRTVNQDGFKPNLETQLIPLLATKTENATADSTEKNNVSSSKDVHHQLLLQVIVYIMFTKSDL